MKKINILIDPYLKKDKNARIGEGKFFADHYFPSNFDKVCHKCNASSSFFNTIHLTKRDENGKIMGIYREEYQCQSCFQTQSSTSSENYKSLIPCKNCSSEEIYRNHPILCKECGTKL